MQLPSSGEGVFPISYYKASDKSVNEVTRNYTYNAVGLESLYVNKVPSFSCIFEAVAVAH